MPRSKATSTPDRRPAPAVPTFRFVGGKGGVGKTTCAAALGLTAARRGRRTLIVSTDPAPSLADALRQPLGASPRPIRGRRHLHAVEVDAAAALERWIAARRQLLEEIALRGTWLDRDDVAKLLRLSLPGIDEIAGLFELSDYSTSGRYDHIVVDTAPTGHMLRMLAMPALLGGLAQVFDRMQGKHRIMVNAIRGGWTPDAADALIESIDEQAKRMDAILRDPALTALAWVTLPEPMALEETRDALEALTNQRVSVDRLIVNRLTAAPPQPCRWCRARRSAERRVLEALERESRAAGYDMSLVPAATVEPRGLTALEKIGGQLDRPRNSTAPRSAPVLKSRTVAVLSGSGRRGVPDLAPEGTRLLMFGGKGGVGKTTCAAAAAVAIAMRGKPRRVLLLSADPAHSLGDVFGKRLSNEERSIAGTPSNLLIREIDARRGFADLRRRFESAVDELFARVGGSGLGAQATDHERQVLHDLFELAPPGVDELIAVIEVSDAVLSGDAASRFDLAVIDSAPTGHALRLLEMPGLVHDWVKAVMAILLKYQAVTGVGELGSVLLRLSQGLGRLRALLVDPGRTTFVAVTRAAALPQAETLRLLRRLQAASIDVSAVVVNAMGAGTCTRCRGEERTQRRELTRLERALSRVSRPAVIVAPGWMPAPAGAADLRRFAAQWRASSG
jgi:arsenite/tail-anchored protein-transporting ATPase